MKVIIAGAGNVGTFIASDLKEEGHDVLLMEVEQAVADRVDPDLGIALLVGDACEVNTLYAAGMDDADVVVAATGDDEDNLVISLLAKQEFAVPRVVARVNHPKNRWLFTEAWGVDIAVSAPHLLSALVEEAVSVGAIVRLLQFEGSEAHLIEVTLADSSPAAGKTIEGLQLPRDASVVAVIRDSHVVVPRGDTILEVGNEVLVLVADESENLIRKLLVGP